MTEWNALESSMVCMPITITISDNIYLETNNNNNNKLYLRVK